MVQVSTNSETGDGKGRDSNCSFCNLPTKRGLPVTPPLCVEYVAGLGGRLIYPGWYRAAYTMDVHRVAYTRVYIPSMVHT